MGQRFGEDPCADRNFYVRSPRRSPGQVSMYLRVNVTGHGWRQAAAAPSALDLPYSHRAASATGAGLHNAQAKLDNTGGVHGTLNMGAGFAFCAARPGRSRPLPLPKPGGVDAWVAGQVEAGPKQKRSSSRSA